MAHFKLQWCCHHKVRRWNKRLVFPAVENIVYNMVHSRPNIVHTKCGKGIYGKPRKGTLMNNYMDFTISGYPHWQAFFALSRIMFSSPCHLEELHIKEFEAWKQMMTIKQHRRVMVFTGDKMVRLWRSRLQEVATFFILYTSPNDERNKVVWQHL